MRSISGKISAGIKGVASSEEHILAMYSGAACMFEAKPQVVVFPRSYEDVIETHRVCHEEGIPITGRGAGSSVTGAAIGSGAIIDYSRFMKSVVALDRGNRTVTVEPGITLKELNGFLARYDLFFPPDPASGSVATLGGMASTNAGGIHALQYGSTRKFLRGALLVLDDGTSVRLTDRNKIRSFGSTAKFSQTGELLRRSLSSIVSSKPNVPKCSSGYWIYDFDKDGTPDYASILAGSEGTLASFAELTLDLLPRPLYRRGFAYFARSLEEAVELVGKLEALKPTGLEFVDEIALKLVAQASTARVPEGARAMVAADFEGFSEEPLAVQVRKAKSFCRNQDEFHEAADAELAKIWSARKKISPALERHTGYGRPTRFVEDICVRPEKVFELIRALNDIFKSSDVVAAIFGHIGSGNIHINVFLDMVDGRDDARLLKIYDQTAAAVLEMGGVMSGEHGDGIIRAHLVRRFFPNVYDIFAQIKNIFDPRGLMNPEKKISNRDIRDVLKTVRSPFSNKGHELLQPCNGCAKCRAYCPAVGLNTYEFESPRGKISILRAGTVPHGEQDKFTADLKLCESCRKCLTDCPAGVNMPEIAKRALEDFNSF